MAKTKETAHYRVLRTEKIARGETTYDLTAGGVRDDLPDDLIEALSGEYGAIELVPEGTLEVQLEDGTWVAAPEEEPADG